jgi:bifunctional UDP-N-acetylglucosamine pyrophosphorylase/glucosamine-1-phosphate N-acetyltransferase
MADGFTVLIMAAGRGTRMRSRLPKVLHPVCGKPMVEWVIDAARDAGAERAVVVTRPGDGVAEGVPQGVDVAEQAEGEGTGAAVLAARDRLEAERPVVILSGDHPLLTADDIRGMVETHEAEQAVATILTTDQLDPAGYGRIVRGEDGAVERIVETKYTEGVPAEELAIREINLGTYAFRTAELLEALDQVELEHGERYLTGVIPVLNRAGGRIAAHLTDDAGGAFGVNDRAQLMEAETVAQRRLLEEHAENGVTFLSPETTRVEASVQIGEDTVVGPGCSLLGATTVGEGAQLGPQTTVIDSRIGARVTAPHSYFLEAEVDDEATIGPFAYLRPGAKIGEGAKVGTFVEVKNSSIGRGAKVPHLSYIGDADVGEDANLGASTITANYDGRKKHRTRWGVHWGQLGDHRGHPG